MIKCFFIIDFYHDFIMIKEKNMQSYARFCQLSVRVIYFHKLVRGA